MVESKHALTHYICVRTCNNSYDPNCNKLHQLLGNSALDVHSFIRSLPSRRPGGCASRAAGGSSSRCPRLVARGRSGDDYVGELNGPPQLTATSSSLAGIVTADGLDSVAAAPPPLLPPPLLPPPPPQRPPDHSSCGKISTYVEPTSGNPPGKV
jgi:hypothetical protein